MKYLQIIFLSTILLFSTNNNLVAQSISGTLSPSETDPVCPGVTNTRNFTIQLTNVSNTNVEVHSQNKLTVTNLIPSNNNTLIITIWFEDQNALNSVVPSLRLRRNSDKMLFSNTFEFTKVLLLSQRNIFPASTINQLNIQVPFVHKM